MPVNREESLSSYRIEGIEKGLLLLAEENKALRQTISILVEEVRGIREENRSLKTFLSPPSEPVKAIRPWQPEKVKDPLESLGFFERIWAQVVEPQKMRQFDS